ncbi:MAG: cytochrome c [Gammaproteobacteria bacterium]|nr:cytochrome c [Gammaproteobacteria bacterium]
MGIAQVSHAQNRIQADIGYRKALMVAMQWNLVRIAQMLRHQRPYDALRLQSEAQAIAALSTMPWVAFVPGSDRGYTKAKAAIWRNPAGFSLRVRTFEAQAAQLASAAPRGLAAVQRPLEAVARGCHACHERFMR